jgi:hypothetical protein
VGDEHVDLAAAGRLDQDGMTAVLGDASPYRGRVLVAESEDVAQERGVMRSWTPSGCRPPR